jgi:predicted Kef-type K+ transport protein
VSIDPNILIVIAVLVVLLAASSMVAGWVNRQWSWPAFAALVIGLGLLGFLHLSVWPGGLGFWDLPMAFINVAAMVLN